MTGDVLTSELIKRGMSFPEGVPTRWHYCPRGDTPRTILCYERYISFGKIGLYDAPCIYQEYRYSEIFTLDVLLKWPISSLYLYKWDFSMLCVARRPSRHLKQKKE